MDLLCVGYATESARLAVLRYSLICSDPKLMTFNFSLGWSGWGNGLDWGALGLLGRRDQWEVHAQSGVRVGWDGVEEKVCYMFNAGPLI